MAEKDEETYWERHLNPCVSSFCVFMLALFVADICNPFADFGVFLI